MSCDVPFVVDADDYDKIKNLTWMLTNTYIATSKMIDWKKYTTYIHQFVMNHKFDGKIYVDHINRIHLDNRKVNLRLATQSEQNMNQKKK